MVAAIQSLLNGKTKTITAAAVLISASSLASRFLGVVRDRLLVSQFGVGDQLDIYYASFQIPNFIFNLLILGTLSVAFIPVFAEYWTKDDTKEAWEITNTILNVTLLLMGVLCAVLFIVAPLLAPWIAPGFGGEKLHQTISLTRLLLLSPIFFSINAVTGSVLNATKRFLSVAVGPVIYNSSIIIGIVVAAPVWGIWGVGVAVVAGAFLYSLLQVASCYAMGYRYRMATNTHHPAVRSIAKLFFPRIWGMDVSQISLLIGTVIGSTLVSGSVAIFNLSVNIQSVPVGVLAIPFVIAAFPNLTEAVATKQLHQYVAAFSYTIRQILFFLLPMSVLTIVLRAHIIRLIIGTRQLSWDDTRLAAAALGIFAVGFVAQGVTPLLSRAFYALKDTRRPVFASIASIVVNVIATSSMLWWLGSGDAGVEVLKSILRLDGVNDIRVLSLPIGFTVAVFFNMIVLVVWLRLRFGELEYALILRRSVPITIASIAAGVVTYGTLDLMTPLVNTHTFWGILGQVVVSTVMGLVTYALASLILRSKEMWQFLRSLERRMIKMVGLVDLSSVEEL